MGVPGKITSAVVIMISKHPEIVIMFFRLKLLPITVVVFSYYFLKYGVYGSHCEVSDWASFQLISDRTAVCIHVKVNEHFPFNVTTESTVCDVEKPKPTFIPELPL